MSVSQKVFRACSGVRTIVLSFILKEVLKYLRDKKTKIALYTYDAILFDYAKEDGEHILNELALILSENKKYPVKIKTSENLVL